MRRLRRGKRARDARARHQYPLAELAVISELNLVSDVAFLVEHFRMQRIADVDHIAAIEQIAAVADRHHLHFRAAFLARVEVRKHVRVLAVHVAVKILEARRPRMRMAVGERAADQMRAHAKAALPQSAASAMKSRLDMCLLIHGYTFCASCASFRFDAGFLDDFAPFRDFRVQESR